jgi:hypothetical protein
MSALNSMLRSNFRAWISAKGFWLVVAGALLPLVLTGAWVGAHRADVEVTSLVLEGAPYEEGETARFVATVRNSGGETVPAFNMSLAVGRVEAGRLLAAPGDSNTTTIDGLGPGEERQVVLEWNATPGIVFVLATADQCEQEGLECVDKVGEKDEFNNQKAEPIAVSRKAPTTPPAQPVGLAGDANATTDVDLVVESLSRSSQDIKHGDNVTFSLTVKNNGADLEGAQVVLRVARAIGARSVSLVDNTQNVSFAAGESKTFELAWTAQDGSYWLEGYVLPPAGTKDVASEDNFRTEGLVANPTVTPEMRPPDPEERLTIKQFYLQVLSILHLRLLIPLIALFYAAGVIADEKERGSLAYVLTRPVPRWLIPITKFVASFLVAALAILVGLLLTYLFLFGTTSEAADIGFLTTPVLMSILLMFVYGAVFILLGVLVERPYLWGLAIVLGWENAANLLVPWVKNLTVLGHLQTVIFGANDGPADAPRPDDGWPLDAGLQWLPGGDEAMKAFFILLAIGVGALVLASVQMRRREFQVG